MSETGKADTSRTSRVGREGGQALAGKCAVVTGSTSGIGLGIARAMVGAGISVMLNGRGDPKDIEPLRAELQRELTEARGDAAGKVIYANMSGTTHVGWMQHIDAIYDEFGDHAVHLNRAALLGVHKPVMAWTHDAAKVRPDPDAFFQRHLHLGVYPTAPLPGNDHTILPETDTDQHYLDYGPLLDALRGKRWVLQPHCIEVADARAKVNLFEVPGGYVVPVTFGKADRVSLVLRGLARLPGQESFRAEVIHPGGTGWVSLSVQEAGDTLSLDVPLVRGCAMVKLAYAWIEPKAAYFGGSANITMGTTLTDAVLRYTLDGSTPSGASDGYEKPIKLNKTTLIRAAAFKNGNLLGEVMTVEFVNVPADAPEFLPAAGGFDESLQVQLEAPAGAETWPIHYTLDGSVPTENSPGYRGPVTLKQTTVLRAGVFQPGRDGCVGSAEFYRRGPKPPAPAIHLSDLSPVRATTGWGDKPRMNRSITNKPLTLGGLTYQKGVGVHANSELEYTLKPDYKRFVSVVGLDDSMKTHPEGSVAFEVWIDGQRLEQTRIFRPGEYGYIDLAIPQGSQVIRLVVSDAIDGKASDHGDWANAGFVVDPNGN